MLNRKTRLFSRLSRHIFVYRILFVIPSVSHANLNDSWLRFQIGHNLMFSSHICGKMWHWVFTHDVIATITDIAIESVVFVFYVLFSENTILTGSVNSRWTNSGVVFALTQNLIQYLFLLFTKINFCIVRTACKRNECWLFIIASSTINKAIKTIVYFISHLDGIYYQTEIQLEFRWFAIFRRYNTFSE